MFVARIIHKVMIEVNETGTTAAAATVCEIFTKCGKLGPEPKFVLVDRPFIFLIMSSSDLVCFAGICAQP